jgi:hypothetical protein
VRQFLFAAASFAALAPLASSDAGTFHYAYTRELLRNGAVVRTKTWREVIPRDLQ